MVVKWNTITVICIPLIASESKYLFESLWGFPGGSDVKNLPALWETWVQPLGWEDTLKKGMTTHSSIIAWRIPMDRGAWWATVHGPAKSQI